MHLGRRCHVGCAVGRQCVASGFIEAGWTDEQGSLHKSSFRFLAVLQKQKRGKLVATQSKKFGQPATLAKH